jgi:hypothetical protein
MFSNRALRIDSLLVCHSIDLTNRAIKIDCLLHYILILYSNERNLTLISGVIS